MEKARSTKAKHASKLMKKKNVVAVGIGYKIRNGVQTNEICVIVSVTKKVSPEALRAKDLIPKDLDGVSTDVIQTGVIKALSVDHAKRYRPAPGGVSIGHKAITAGTLGCYVTSGETGERMILSNNHVLANSNAGYPGDEILQPGPYDGGEIDNDLIATLYKFIKIDFGETEADCKIAIAVADVVNWFAERLGSSHRLWPYKSMAVTNKVDCALARVVKVEDIMSEILEIGYINNQAPVANDVRVGDTLQKSGRTTGLSFGSVLQLDVTASVEYGEGLVAVYENQIMADGMSAGGDSGSLVLNEERQAVGLLFAGSDQVTIMNPIQLVLDALNARMI